MRIEYYWSQIIAIAILVLVLWSQIIVIAILVLVLYLSFAHTCGYTGVKCSSSNNYAGGQ
jgi:hypothetical protein